MMRTSLTALLPALLSACAASPGTGHLNEPEAVAPYFPESEFWQPIPDDPEIDPDNATYIKDLLGAHMGGRLNLNLTAYSVPFWRAQQDTPKVDVRITPPGGAASVLRGVPIPPGTKVAAGFDGHLVVLDERSHTSYEFYQARREGSTWRASSFVPFDTRGDGINRKGSGIRASSLSLLLGLITYDEVKSGAPIRHALAWAFDLPNSRYYTPPAASSDAKRTGGRTTSIPEGARVQLDPALDLSTLGLSAPARRIAEALQRYGMFCVDGGGDSSVIAEEVEGHGRSWNGLLAWDDLHKIPVKRLRVLRMREKIPIP